MSSVSNKAATTAITRRDALRTIAATSALMAFPSILRPAFARAADEAADSKSDAAGTFKQSVCKWCYKKFSVEKLAIEAKRIGLRSVELLELEEIPIVQKLGLDCAVTYVPRIVGASGRKNRYDSLNRRELHPDNLKSFELGIARAAALKVPNVICFTGNRIKGQSDQEGLEVCVEILKQIAPIAEKHKVTVILELFNHYDHRGYLGDKTAWGVELVKKVGSERVKILYDIYHMAREGDDVIPVIRANKDYFGHYHTAGVPKRNEFEPQDNQKLDYPAIMRAIHATGYRGYIGHEFLPKRDPIKSLEAAYEICKVA
ncbi:MAG: TIM barrel protein [Puniceicoccales bacterium]|jgi:hydroxypyruvate isomerase|nr:TIM barrel protein [Puniceicoccales bacterium]